MSSVSDRRRRLARPVLGRPVLGLRLVLGFAGLFVAGVLVLAVLTYVLFLHYLRAPDRALMAEQARTLAAAHARGGLEALRADLGGFAHDPRRDELLVRLADDRGHTLLLSNPDNWTAAEIDHLARTPAPAREAWVALGPAEDEDALEAFVLRLDDGHVLQVGLDAELRKDALASMREVFLVIVLPVAVLALLGGALLAYRALLPLRRLVASLHAVIDTADVETRVPVDAPGGEFAEVVVLFNRMLDRIEALMTGVRGTLDAVAHDLRTPLTRLRGRAELALQSADASACHEALVDNLETTEAVMAMLETILEVAEAETGTMPLHLEPVDPAALVAEVTELYGFVAEEKGVGLVARAAPGLRLRADRSRLRRALANLVDNAVKYTPGGGHVAVEAHAVAGGVAFVVADDGPGIDPADLPRIFDRLYRADRSRHERGLGLGLSLVRAIAAAHGGRVDAASPPGQGATFTLTLPAGNA